jgi:metallo-beta-lactamase class B
MEEKKPTKPEDLMKRVCKTPWESWIAPFRIAPHVYSVSGNDWVCSYLIDTGDGLILIDTAMHESCYLLIESIRQLGFDPHDIKLILLSHAHGDHIGAARTMKELTGAKLYLGKRDLFFLTARRDLIFHEDYTCGEFIPDEFYDGEKPVHLGNFDIRTVSTPGHTPGCTSFLFETTDDDGKKYICGMHGGIGLNTLSKEFLTENNLPLSLQQEFLDALKKMDQETVDICLPSHFNQVPVIERIPADRKDFHPFIDREALHVLLHKRMKMIEELMEK